MALTIKQLENLYSLAWIAHSGLPGGEGHENRTKFLGLVSLELHRLTHGPFTRAEAIASKRPFKRPGWDDYVCFSSPTGWTPGFPMKLNEGRLGKIPDTNLEDELATDYELLPEGGH